MSRTLRDIWRDHITAADYERHMAAVGQAQANASLLEELFRLHAPRNGARILFPGAGTGQCFDYLSPTILAPFRVTFTDINPTYLARLSQRLTSIDFATVIDDIESPRLMGPFDLAIVILVLEHVAWRKAVANLTPLSGRLFVVIQQNPETLNPRPLLQGTMSELQEVPPTLVDPAELVAAVPSRQVRSTHRDVPDGKRMLAFDFLVA